MKNGSMYALGCGAFAIFALCCGCCGLIYMGAETLKELDVATEAFLAQVGSGDTAGAYQSGSTTLRSSQTEEEFAASMKTMEITEYQAVTWTNRGITNNDGFVEGTIQTKTGKSIPIKMTLVKEGEVWKVSSIALAPAAPGGPVVPPPPTEPGSRPTLTDPEMKKLAKETLAAFAKAVKSGNFTELRESTASPMKQKFTAEQLKELFQAFVDNKLDLTAVASETPVFDTKPGVKENGDLILTGYVLLSNSRVLFKLTYIYEHPSWKLNGINVETTSKLEK